METNTTIFAVIISTLKWLFPSLVGSLLAVWYKRNDPDWKKTPKVSKFKTFTLALAAIIVGVIISWSVGGVIINYANLSAFEGVFLVYFIVSLSSLKLLDAVVKNIDPIIDMIMNGVTEFISKSINSILDKFKR